MRRDLCAVFLAAVLSPACATTPGSPTASAPAPSVAEPSLKEADRALETDRLGDALALYERIALSGRASGERREAMERAAFLRASNRPGLRDLGRVQAWTSARRVLDGPPSRLFEIEALEALAAELSLRDEELRARLAELERLQDRLDDLQVESRGRAGELRTLRSTNAGLRTAVARLQAEATRLQAELQQKDDILKKIAASVAGGVGQR